jgi:hypothetical protein
MGNQSFIGQAFLIAEQRAEMLLLRLPVQEFLAGRLTNMEIYGACVVGGHIGSSPSSRCSVPDWMRDP